MFKSLNGPAIGIKLPLPDLAHLARETGFAGVDFDMNEALSLPKSPFEGLKPGAWGLPVREVQSEWDVDLDLLAAGARWGAAHGATRCATWVPSWNNRRDLAENIAYHIARLTPAARVLADHGCRLGLEFLGPATLYRDQPFAFIHAMQPMLDMARRIGPNVGLLLDAWHLFTSGATLVDMARLTNADIVYVHINDAPPGVPFDQVTDTVRHLPLETGVLDLAGFLRVLVAMGYDGPVATEPFNARINAIAARDPRAAATEVSAAMNRLWNMARLG
jgi:sugar phosphate isomerase/epimerase